MHWFLFCVLVIQFTCKEPASAASEDNLDSNGYHRCNDDGVCLPGAEDIAVKPRTILADNTCGQPPYNKYCPLDKTECFYCNETNHTAGFMIDHGEGYSTSNFKTWWQSQNWHEWLQYHSRQPLPINITISFNKSYVLTGDIRVTFKFAKPAKMVMEKSTDFGLTWTPLQYFAYNCKRDYGMEASELNCSTSGHALCTEKYSDHNGGPLYFSYLNCYNKKTFWSAKIQEVIEATDLKLRLEFPANDGFFNSQQYQQRYFYAISDVQIYGRCQCHGHAPDCNFTKNSLGEFKNTPTCQCGKGKHNTEGDNCERCQPLYNNKTWMPATSMEKPNPCEKCECHQHASSCTYNATLGHGICDNCKHNTTGYFCEQCQDKYYRNTSKALNDPLVCLDCYCALEGVTNNGSCSQKFPNIGQCQCKKNVTGRRCDRCNDTFYGYTNPPVGNCRACLCSKYGTNRSLNCDQKTGQCTCKNNTELRTCSQCKLGYYKFPRATDQDCLECDCDSGGRTPDICEKEQGKCLCRYGIQNERCSNVTKDRFYPKYDYFLYEAEYQPGNYTVTSNLSEYEKQFFTGRGYAEINNTQYIEFNVSLAVKNNFSIALRYSDAVGRVTIWIKGNSTSECKEVNQKITVDNLQHETRGDWQWPERLEFCSGTKYNIRVDSDGSIKVDSLLLVPDLTELISYKFGASIIKKCQKNATSIQESIDSESQCKDVTFSTMVELFNGSLACDCNLDGAKSTRCEPYGGQCPCKVGVMGRTCDRCQPGYYNFTKKGCTACKCNDFGSTNFVCEPASGQCDCKRAVEGRACDHCEKHSYGIHTGEGCTSCNCNATGSVNMSCDGMTGMCYCKPGVVTNTCGRCEENYFNFTQDGCQSCNCDEAGSRSLQCHYRSGECSCKSNTNGTKCSQCIKGTFSLEKENPSGCLPCFCFNRSRECKAASGFILSEIKQSNLTILTPGYHRLSERFQGYHLNSYVRKFEVNLTETSNNTAVELHLKGLNFSVSFKLKLVAGMFLMVLHEKNSVEKINNYQMQSILADVHEAALNISGDLGNDTKVSVAMKTAIRATRGNQDGNDAKHVEQCECPKNYKGLSCRTCSEGFTREISNSSDFVNCGLCACNNRSKNCDGETGVCIKCRLSKGDHCEECGDGVDIETRCTQCSPMYWHPEIAKEEKGCRACNCELSNTLYHNSSVCNSTTGQCLCKSYVGGRRCDRCAENYYNTTQGCRQCPECYGLLIVFVHKLRDDIEKVQGTVQSLNEKFRSRKNNTFGKRLKEAEEEVDNIFLEANKTDSQNFYNPNTTIDDLDDLTSSIQQLKKYVEDLERRQRKLQNLFTNASYLTKTSYSSLQQANDSRTLIEDMREVIKGFIQPLERVRNTMSELNQTLWNNAENLTITSDSQLQKINQVYSNAKSVGIKIENNTNGINSLQNATQASLEDSKETLNTSMDVSSRANNFFNISKDILVTVRNLNELIEDNKNLLKKFNYSIFPPSSEYESSITNTSILLKETKYQNSLATDILNSTEDVLTEVNTILQKAKIANDSAMATLKNALDTRKTLNDFQNLSRNAADMAKESEQEISNIRAESEESIKIIRNVSMSVQDGLKDTDEAMRLADEAKTLAQNENQGVIPLYNRSKTLDEHHRSTVCSSNRMKTYNQNITTRSNLLTPLLARCPLVEARHVSDRTKDSLNQSYVTQEDSQENYQDVKIVNETVLESELKVKTIEKTVKAKTHETRLDTHSKLFEKLRNEISKLKQAKERRAILIKQMKERVETIKLEIKDLESLRDSIPPCLQE